MRMVNRSNPACPCLFDLSAHGIFGDLIASVHKKAYNLGPRYGLSICAPHDEGTEPFCHPGVEGGVPDWCSEPWCYVDPTDCRDDFEVVNSSYFAGVMYSTAACGAGADDFSGWYAANGTIGGVCATSSECLGLKTRCLQLGSERICGCPLSSGLSGPDCTEPTAASAWLLCSCVLAACVYVACVMYMARVLALPRRDRSSTSSGGGGCFALTPLVWALLSCLTLLGDLCLKLSNVFTFIDLVSYDLASGVLLSAGASAGIYAYTSVASSWLRLIEATRRAGRVRTAQLRVTRRVLAALAALFGAVVVALVGLTLAVDISFYTYTVALDMFAAALIFVAFQYGGRALTRLGRAVAEEEAAEMARRARRPTVLAAIRERLRRMSRASARLGQGGGCDATAATHFAYDEADAAAAAADEDAADEAAADEDAAGLPEESLVLSPGFGLTPRVAISFAEPSPPDATAAPGAAAEESSRAELSAEHEATDVQRATSGGATSGGAKSGGATSGGAGLPLGRSIGQSGASARVQLIARTARRISVSLFVFLVAGGAWVVAKQLSLVWLEWVAVLLLHSAHACSVGFVARYFVLYRRVMILTEQRHAAAALPAMMRATSDRASADSLRSSLGRSRSALQRSTSSACSSALGAAGALAKSTSAMSSSRGRGSTSSRASAARRAADVEMRMSLTKSSEAAGEEGAEEGV